MTFTRPTCTPANNDNKWSHFTRQEFALILVPYLVPYLVTVQPCQIVLRYWLGRRAFTPGLVNIAFLPFDFIILPVPHNNISSLRSSKTRYPREGMKARSLVLLPFLCCQICLSPFIGAEAVESPCTASFFPPSLFDYPYTYHLRYGSVIHWLSYSLILSFYL